jgi:predicted MFS family arabinose efflux permease
LILLLLFASETSRILAFVPGLFVLGAGVGIMLTASVNIVQSSFPEEDQGEISGLSRSVSNLGSSMGVAIAGTVLVSAAALGNQAYALALIVLVVVGLVGLIAAWLLPPAPVGSSKPETDPT